MSLQHPQVYISIMDVTNVVYVSEACHSDSTNFNCFFSFTVCYGAEEYLWQEIQPHRDQIEIQTLPGRELSLS